MKQLYFLLIFLFSNAMFSQTQFLDSSFGNNGLIKMDGGYNMEDRARAVAVTADGKILVGGHGMYSTGIRFSLIVRYNSDGTLDTSFAENGKFIINNISMQSSIVDLKVLENGKIQILGEGFYNDLNNTATFVGRLNQDGSIDTTFATNGFNLGLINPYGNNKPSHLLLDNSGKILVFNDTYVNSGGNNNFFCVNRLNSNGTKDISFGNNGISNLFLGGNLKSFLCSDGSVIVAAIDTLPFKMKVYKLSPVGNLDSSFNNTGSQEILFSGKLVSISSGIFVTSDQKIIVLGNDPFSFGPSYVIAKLLPDGSFDHSFGTGGKKVFICPNNGGNVNNFDIMDTFLTADNKIVFAGYRAEDFSDSDFVIFRTDINGELDNSFGLNGQIAINFDNNSDDVMLKFIFQNDGKIVSVGLTIKTNPNGYYDWAISRTKSFNLSSTETDMSDKKIIVNSVVKDYLYFFQKLNTKFQIFDTSGRMISMGTINNETKLNLEKLNDGYYFISIDGKYFKLRKE